MISKLEILLLFQVAVIFIALIALDLSSATWNKSKISSLEIILAITFSVKKSCIYFFVFYFFNNDDIFFAVLLV
jgi:hypothetical protein